MKTVIIGTGRMGRRHIQIVKKQGLELVGIYDQNPESLELAAKEQGVSAKYHFTNVTTLLEQTKPECVIIATTATSHCEYTCLAAQAGAKYILCEKPMAISLAECDRMLETCQQHHVHLAINHQIRFLEVYNEPKRIVQSESFGGLSSMNIIAGNLGIAMGGTHMFEMFRYVTGEEPFDVTAWFSKKKVPNPRGPQFEDRAGSVRVTTAGGKRLYMDIGTDQGHGLKVIYAGPYGQLILDVLEGTIHYWVREEQYRKIPTTRYDLPHTEKAYNVQPIETIDSSLAVLNALLNHESPPTGEEARFAITVLVAAYVSDENGHIPVQIDSNDLPRDRKFPWA